MRMREAPDLGATLFLNALSPAKTALSVRVGGARASGLMRLLPEKRFVPGPSTIGNLSEWSVGSTDGTLSGLRRGGVREETPGPMDACRAGVRAALGPISDLVTALPPAAACFTWLRRSLAAGKPEGAESGDSAKPAAIPSLCTGFSINSPGPASCCPGAPPPPPSTASHAAPPCTQCTPPAA